jgi:hypothetical protein
MLLSRVDVYYLLTHTHRKNARAIVKKINDSTHNPTNEDAEDVAEIEAVEERWNCVGLGGVVYTLLIQSKNVASLPSTCSFSFPRVFSPVWLFLTVLPYVTALLRHSSLRVLNLGVELMTYLSTELLDRGSVQLDPHIAFIGSDERDPFLNVVQAFVDYIVRIPDQDTRLAQVRTLHAFLSLIALPLRFELLAKICQFSPYTHVTAALIDRLKYDITEAVLLPNLSPRDWIPIVLRILTSILQPSPDIISRSECVIATLNCLRFLLLKDPIIDAAVQCTVQLKTKSEPPRIDPQRPVRPDLYQPRTSPPSPLSPTPLIELLPRDLLTKLQNETLLPFEQWLVTYIRTQLKIAEQTSPPPLASLDPSQFEQSQQQCILQLQLTHTLLVRVRELINTKLKSLSKDNSSV